MTGETAIRPPTSRGLLLTLAIAYTAFVVYGSLVPLDFRPRPLEQAWVAFEDIRHLKVPIGSGPDWVANILLFVPIAFLWLGVWWPWSNRLAQATASVFVLACCAALSVAIEFTQLFFPPRTSSLNDILANVSGSSIGIVAWWAVGPRVAAWFAGWTSTKAGAGTAERLLYAYLFVLFGYNLLPLDLTISPVEIFHKWREGKILLIPFQAHFPSAAQRAYDLASDAAIWIPVGYLWQLSSRRPPRQVVLRVVACAAALELLQLFVYSRVTDTTDIVTAAVGAIAGTLAASRFSTAFEPAEHAVSRSSAAGAWLWLVAILAWLGVLMAVFWYPFDFNTQWGFVHRRFAAMPRVPLASYYYGTEFRAATEVLHKFGFFLPLGVLLAISTVWVRRRLPFIPAILTHAVAAGIIGATAAAIEAGQLFLPGKNADPTDWVLEFLGGLAGYVGSLYVASRRADRYGDLPR